MSFHSKFSPHSQCCQFFQWCTRHWCHKDWAGHSGKALHHDSLVSGHLWIRSYSLHSGRSPVEHRRQSDVLILHLKHAERFTQQFLWSYYSIVAVGVGCTASIQRWTKTLVYILTHLEGTMETIYEEKYNVISKNEMSITIKTLFEQKLSALKLQHHCFIKLYMWAELLF